MSASSLGMRNYLVAVKNKLLYLTFAAILLCQTACVSWQSVANFAEADLPPVQICSKSVGERSFSLYVAGDFQFSALMSYEISPELMSAEIFDAMGRTHVGLELGRDISKLYGPFSNAMPSVVVNRQGFVFVNDVAVGVALDELACLMGGRVPGHWVRAENSRLTKNKKKLRFDGEGRSIILSRDSSGWNSFCASVSVAYL